MKNKEMSLGECIRMQRIELELTVRDLAAMADISPTFLSAIENGKRVPSPKVVPALARCLKINASELAARVAIFKVTGIQNKTNTDLGELVRFYQTKIRPGAEAR